jgi:membrane-associated phospholipid phosphatase
MPNIDADERQAIINNGRVIWCAAGLMLIAVCIGFRAARLSFDLLSGMPEFLVLAACVAVAFYYRRYRPDPWISFGAETSAQLATILTLGMLLSYPLAAAAFPYRDAQLHSVDLWLGFNWRGYLHFMNDHPTIGMVGKFAYRSMRPQFLLVIGVLVVTSRFIRLQQYIVATTLALLITLLIFTFTPAVASYAFLQIAPSEYANLTPSVPYEHIRHLQAMRTGADFLISESNLEGLITFPSFHTACGLLFIWALFPVRRLRWWVVGLNAMLVLSTPIEGAHYFIDLIGGAVVTALAVCGAKLIAPERRTAAASPQLYTAALKNPA